MTTTTDTEEQQMLTDWLTTAVEGGIGYWSYAKSYRWDCPPAERHVTLIPADAEDDEFTETRVGLAEIKAAMQKIAAGDVAVSTGLVGLCTLILRDLDAGQRWLDLDESSQYDAGDADCVMQVAVLGTVVYG